jgi:hypothetical protein
MLKKTIPILVITAMLLAVLPFAVNAPSYAAGAARVAAPKSVKASAIKAGQIRVTWKKSPGASGYIIYMAKQNVSTGKPGKYKKIRTVKKPGVVGYTKKSLKAGTKYYFKVKAYKGKAKSGFSKAKAAYAKRAGPEVTKIAPLSPDDIVLEWKKAKGAISYNIQYKSGKNGKWTPLGAFGGNISKPKTSFSPRSSGGDIVAGKTIYVRMNATVMAGKVILSSVWGKAKAVRMPKKSKYKRGYDNPDYYMDRLVLYKKGHLPLDGHTWEGAIGKYLSMGEDGKDLSMSGGRTLIRWPDEQIHQHAGCRIKVVDPSCIVMWTMDGSEPGLTNGTKVTEQDGAVWVWQDRGSITVKARGYVGGKEVFYASATNGQLMYYEELKRDIGIDPGPADLWPTDGYYTDGNPRPPYHEKDFRYAW